LIENALKHNELTPQYPLELQIFEQEGRIWVQNSIRLKNLDADSEGYGTQLIANVYDFYQVKGFEIQVDESVYTVILPSIKSDIQ